MSLNLVRPLINVGEIQEVDVRPTSRLEPLGVLRPTTGAAEAAALLCAHLRAQSALSPLDLPQRAASPTPTPPPNERPRRAHRRLSDF